MAYECQNFKDGQILTAACLNRIEKALEGACNKEVVSASVNDSGELVIVFADATQLNCGCVASSVKCIESVEQNENGALTFTYADGSTYVAENVGGGDTEQIQADYAQNDSTVKDYIKNRPFYEDEPIPTEFLSSAEMTFTYATDEGFAASGTPSTEMLALWASDWENCVFTWDGAQYVCEPQYYQGVKFIGNFDMLMGTGDSGEPFIMMCADASLMGEDIWMIYDLETEVTDTTADGDTVTHEVSLSINLSNITKLDPKYLENIDYEKQLINKPFGTTPSGTVLFDDTVTCNSDGVAIWNYIELIEGVTYTVEVDGTAYTATAAIDDSFIALVLDSASSYMVMAGDGITVLLYPEGEHAVKITLAEDAVKKIDEKYIPESTGGSSLPEVTTDDAGKILRVNADGTWEADAETAELPTVTTDDNDKILQVVDGVWTAVTLEDSAVKTYIDSYIEEALGGEY